jgi:phosphatidylserine/phosphatidylglycerophosphate/cardiolipin synthase-like enzyme
MKQLIFASLFVACTTSPIKPVPDSSTESKKVYEVPVEEQQDFESSRPPMIEVHFSPKGGCTDSIDSFIETAQKEIDLMAYSFTSSKIIAAIGRKSESDAGKPIKVTAVLDRSDVGTPIVSQLENEDVAVFIDEKHAIMHNKFIIIDKKSVETGSFNFTNQAENANAENCLIIRDATIATQYEMNFQFHLSHSIPAAVALEKYKAKHAPKLTEGD